MIISEMIAKLEAIKAEYGDVAVMKYGRYLTDLDNEDIEVAHTAKQRPMTVDEALKFYIDFANEHHYSEADRLEAYEQIIDRYQKGVPMYTEDENQTTFVMI